jgi:hypothetical protein
LPAPWPLTPPPGRPSTRPWAEPCTGQRHTPSSRHPSMAFRCSPPRHPPLTRPWAEPRTGRRRMPSSRHPSLAFPCSRWDPRSLCLHHHSRHPRCRGSGSGTRSLSPAALVRWRLLPHARDRLGGRLQCHQPYHTPPRSHFVTQAPSLAHPSSIIVGNGYVLPVTSVGDSMLPGPFYLNDVLIALDLV